MENLDTVINNENKQLEKLKQKSDFIAPVIGNMMAPEYPEGSKILIKKIDHTAFIAWGEAYVIDTINGAIFKRIQSSDKKGFIKCVNANPDYKDCSFDLSLNQVNGIYRVLACLSLKSITL